MDFGKLQEVPVRELWKHEQYNFSAWLAKPENIEYLNDILGLTLIEVKTEVPVGSYRCDIFAKDEMSDTKVIVENQLEVSDHDHLGKIITYASGLNADVLVWIVPEAKDEHRSAIEWLNNHIDKDISFFLIELHAYGIGNSLPATKFEIIEQPNNFVKNGRLIENGKQLTTADFKRQDFWEKMNSRLIERGKPFNVRKATTDHWYNVACGTSGVYISITLVNKDSFIGIEFHIDDDKSLFDDLLMQKESIENDLSLHLDWQRLDECKASRILHKIPGLDFDKQDNYGNLIDKTIDLAILMRDVFKKYLK